jgi:hypothetical protein
MKLKLDEKGNAVVQDGNPVYVHDDGSEHPFDAKAAHVALATAKREAGEFRTKLKDAETKLSAYSGIEDPEAALKALQFAASMDGKKVMDDEGIQKLIQSALKPVLAEKESWKEKYEKTESTLYEVMVGEKIATSEFIKKTIYTPADAKRLYSGQFKVEDGKIVPYDQNGSPIYSQKQAGQYADIDEALKVIIDSRPDKHDLYRSSGASGSGSQGSNASGTTQKTMTRTEWDSKGHAERAEFAKSGGKVVD